MLHWFRNKLITDTSADWIHTCMAWALQHFDADAFARRTELVTPDARYFPKPVNSSEEMAEYVLQRVSELAGLQHWPWRLAPSTQCSAEPPPLLSLKTDQRFLSSPTAAPETEQRLLVPFIPEQIKKPQDLVASTAQHCTQHLLWQSQLVPPGGVDFFQQTSEIMAVFFGFGVVLTNSAYAFRGSCAKCYDPRANRTASLSESEVLYALALFATLKTVPIKSVTLYLKPHLRNSYKVALKQVEKHPSITRLHQLSEPSDDGTVHTTVNDTVRNP